MKKITIILLLLSCTFCFSQKKSKEERQKILDKKSEKKYLNENYQSLKKICKVDHSCGLQHKFDSFEDVHIYTIGRNGMIALSRSGASTFSLYRYSRKDLDRYILIMSLKTKECETKDSYINFIFDDGTKLKIFSSTNTVTCGTGSISVDITDHISILSSKKINKFRIFLDRNHDYKAGKKRAIKFVNRIKCISEIVLPKK